MQSDDVVLSLTSGGCNLFDMLLDGPRKVVGVDLNPCQNHLVELKKAAIKRLAYEDAWKMFGEGKHENIREVYRLQLQPFLPQVRRIPTTSTAGGFWECCSSKGPRTR